MARSDGRGRKDRKDTRARPVRGVAARTQPQRPAPSRSTPAAPPSRPAQPGGPRAPRPDDDLIGGLHAVTTLLAHNPRRVRALWCWSRDRQVFEQMQRLAASADLVLKREAPAQAEALGHLAQGVAARVRPFDYSDLDDLVPPEGARPGTLLLVLDSITDAGNLGAIVRSAAFFKATAIILPTDRSAAITPVVERVARGATAILPVVQVVNLARTLRSLDERGVLCCATVLDPDAVELWDQDFDQPIAIVLGAEGKGVRPLLRKQCRALLTLSGEAAVDSLNVASFATVALAAARRPAATRVAAAVSEPGPSWGALEGPSGGMESP